MRRIDAVSAVIALSMTLAVTFLSTKSSGAPGEPARLADGVVLDLSSGIVYVSGDALPEAPYLALVRSTPKLARYFALGRGVTVVLDGKAYRVK